MAYTFITLEISERTAVITIDNPPVNAFHPKVGGELRRAVEAVSNLPDIRSVVITGSGSVFMAGGDIGFFQTLDARSAEAYALKIQDVQAELRALEVPVVAAVNGAALGGGCELMMACDIRVADERAMIGQPEVGLGVIPGGRRHPDVAPPDAARRGQTVAFYW